MSELLIPLATLRRWLWFGAVAGLGLYCWQFWPVGAGAKFYLGAAQCMLDGLALQQCDKFFTYPPAVALLMMPLLILPGVLVNAVWYTVTVGALATCLVLSVTLTRRSIPDDWSERDLFWLYSLGILLSLKFLFAAIGNQNYDAVVVLLVLSGLFCLADKRLAWAGVAMGVAAAMKATPLLFLPYLIFTRRFTAAATMAAAVVIVSLLPDLLFLQSASSGRGSYFMAWITGVAAPSLTEKMSAAPHIFWSAMSGGNYTLRGVVGAFKNDGDLTFSLILWPVYAVYAAIVTAIILRSYRRDWAIPTDGALLLLSMLLLSPLTSLSHFVALILAYVFIAAVWLKGDAVMRPIAGFFLIFTLVTTNTTSDDLVGRVVTEWAQRYRVVVIGMLSLLIFFAIYVGRRVRQEAGPDPISKPLQPSPRPALRTHRQ